MNTGKIDNSWTEIDLTEFKKENPKFKTYEGMKKGDVLTANSDLKTWNLTKGETLIALSKEKFYNGEFHILTSKGWIPSVFFYSEITFNK